MLFVSFSLLLSYFLFLVVTLHAPFHKAFIRSREEGLQRVSLD